jgi:hypothetical protein
VALGSICLLLSAAPKEFWERKEPAAWTDEEKQILLGDSPWAQQGILRMSVGTPTRTPGYGNDGRPATGVPDMRPGVPPGGMKSVPIGEKPPPVPDPNRNRPLEFPVLARWETATPVRLAGGPETPEMSGQFYVIRLRGLPLMPPPKPKPGETPENPNTSILQALKEGSFLTRKNKPPIPCAHLFTGSGNAWSDVLLFFPRSANPLTLADKEVTLDSRFIQFHISIKFPLKEMRYKGELTL